jgi:hypothetical protein
MQDATTQKQGRILSSLTGFQLAIVSFLLFNKKATRKEILLYLFGRGFFHFQPDKTGAVKRLSPASADRILRATVNDIIYKNIPICSDSQNGYYIANSLDEAQHCIGEARSRCAEIEKYKIDGVEKAVHAWLDIPFSKSASGKYTVAKNQLSLFDQSSSCANSVMQYLPEGGDPCQH